MMNIKYFLKIAGRLYLRMIFFTECLSLVPTICIRRCNKAFILWNEIFHNISQRKLSNLKYDFRCYTVYNYEWKSETM
jgi:hypothetical protein